MFHCLDEDVLLCFLERRLPIGDMSRAEAHLDACIACRRLLAEVARAIERTTVPPPPPAK